MKKAAKLLFKMIFYSYGKFSCYIGGVALFVPTFQNCRANLGNIRQPRIAHAKIAFSPEQFLCVAIFMVDNFCFVIFFGCFPTKDMQTPPLRSGHLGMKDVLKL